nr:MAG TPA_asm: hypothetical protein [Caudoviricetes sp.]
MSVIRKHRMARNGRGVKRSAKERCCGTCQNCCISVKCQKFRRYGSICRVVATGTGKRRQHQ